MQYPKFISSRSLIGVVAPSFGVTEGKYRIRYENAILKFKEKGHDIKTSKHLYTNKKSLQASDNLKVRAKEFLDVYLDSDVDGVISVAGGELLCRLMPYLDFEKIKESEPKWFLGFSDNTFISFLLTTMCDIASIYGDCFTSFGMNKWHKSLNDFYSFMLGNKLEFTSFKRYEGKTKRRVNKEGKELDSFKLNKKTNIVCLNNDEVNVKGRVLSGCLDILTLICGTKYDKVKEFIHKYKKDGFIWFIESCDLNVLDQLRALWQLKNASWFKYAKAIVIGRAINEEEMFGKDYYKANYLELKDLNIPIIVGADIGHVAPRMVIVNGAICNLKYKDNKIKIKYELV